MEASPVHFVEEIDYNELQTQEVVGRGAFGVVSRALWRGIQVAVKLIETESERKAFITELKQLSRVNHPNIVKLYGACTKLPVCLVMEYAEGGSLYNVLHKEGPQLQYNIGHAVSWMLQCAKGVAYLHGMKPKPLIHRDLKPPNLLLVAGGHTLKICDFGTACDVHTHMTNNKGSAAWMAPEVFEGCNYSEKCDVFSFGIIVWEVLTRRKPFENLGGPAFRIMWAVHSGTRPPLIKDCPKPIDELMRRCWAANPVERPPIPEVVRLLTHLYPYFPGADEPLTYADQDQVEGYATSGLSSIYDTPPLSNQSSRGTTAVNTQIVSDTVIPGTPKIRPITVEEVHPRRTSAPPSLAASHENLLDKTNSRSSTPSVADINNKRFSADLSKLEEKDILNAGMAIGSQVKHVKTHRRSGSHGTTFVSPSTDPRTQTSGEGRGHRRTGSFGDSSVTQSAQDLSHVAHPCMGGAIQPTIPDHNLPHLDFNNLHRSVSWSPNVIKNATPSPAVAESDPVVLRELFHGNLDVSMQPLPPCNTSQESVAIYVEHMNLIHEYVKIQAEIALLTQTKHDMTKELETSEREEQDSIPDLVTLQRLNAENADLEKWYDSLKKQVQDCRDRQQRRPVPPAAS